MVSKMPGDEVCDEFEWLVTNGMSPVMACEQLGRSVSTMARLLYRYGRTEHIAPLDRVRRSQEREQSGKVQR